MITHIIPPEELPEMVTAVPEEKSEQKLKTVWNHAYIDFKPSGTAITSMDEKLINHAVKYVEDNIARSDLSVEELSKELGMSAFIYIKSYWLLPVRLLSSLFV